MKKFFALLLTVTMIMSLFASVVIADTPSITIALDRTYSDVTLPDTNLYVTPTVTGVTGLGTDVMIGYYLNGSRIARKGNTEEYIIKSVSGPNVLQAKILRKSDNHVYAESNVINLYFKPLTKVENSWNLTDDFERDAINPSDHLNFANSGNGNGFSIVNESADSNNKVLYYDANSRDTYINYPADSVASKSKGSKYIKIEYDIKFTKINGSVRLLYVKIPKKDSGSIDFIKGTSNDTGKVNNEFTFTTNKWYKVQLLLNFSGDSCVYNYTVGGVPINIDTALSGADSAIDYFTVARPMSDVNMKFSIDNVKLEQYEYIEPSLSLNSTITNAVAGTKVKLTAEAAGIGDAQLVYTVNGVESEPTTHLTYYADVVAGVNTVSVKAVGSSNNVLAESEEITYTGIPYTFEYTKNIDFTQANECQLSTTHTNCTCETELVALKKFNIAEVEGASEEDIAQGDVAHLKIVGAGDNWNHKVALSTSPYTETLKNSPKDSAIALDWKVKLLKMEAYPGDSEDFFLDVHYYNNASGRDAQVSFFRFDGSGKLRIAKDFSTGTKSNYDFIPAVDGTWYNFKVVADPKTNLISLIVNDVLYSTFEMPSSFDVEKTRSNFRVDFELGRGGIASGKTLDVYIDDISYAYATTPLYMTPVFYSGSNEIIEKSQIDYTLPLGVEIGIINNGKPISCYAALFDTSGGSNELLAVNKYDVLFEGDEYIEYAPLSLSGLPSDIATNNKYVIKIMLWEGSNLTPLSDVIPFN